jgi:site-specific recombinase XerD
VKLTTDHNSKLGEAKAQLHTSELQTPDTDQQAIQEWLAEYERKPNTLRTYAREARRFWFWWSQARQKRKLSDFCRADLNQYTAVLSNPPAHWLARAGTKEWAPLKAPLNAGSKRQALIILQSLFEHLASAGHIATNPVRLVRDKGPSPARAQRAIPCEASMLAVSNWTKSKIDDEPDFTQSNHRSSLRSGLRGLRSALIWQWIYWTGSRRHELTQATLGNIQYTQNGGQTRWWWQVTGKAERQAKIPLTQQALDTLMSAVACDNAQELQALIRAYPHRAIFCAQRGEPRNIEVSQIYESIRAMARAAQLHAKAIGLDEQEAQLIGATRPHSLRAYRATHLFNAGVDARHVQRFMRHADFNTTLIYDHTREDTFHDAINS